MIRIKFTLLSLLIMSNVIGQDLSKLNPKQLEAYKKYSTGNTTTTPSLNTQNETKDENRTLTEESQKPYTEEKKVTKTTTTTTTLLNVQKPNSKDKKKTSDLNSKNENMNEDESEQTTTTIVTTTVENGEVNKRIIFGSQLFKKQNLTFEPKLNIATPVLSLIHI